ncbi:restriction endonuclease subunit S [Leptospira levettii]|uniref:restriction endonuclease subunit S n=1 Tax=Leptospira levettii TaxID=2023178 RepID=UPI001082B51A|nr:restriction endonuclease subunit S [Leptospira levettii]TGM31417.1 restriction endonuclease subunit S [Leptospira levettii]
MKLSPTNFKPYSEYQETGIAWLGKIPSGWEYYRNKYLFQIKKEIVGKKSSDFTLLSLTLRGVINRDMENPEGKFPSDFDTYQKVYIGDFIFCLFDVEETPRFVGLSKLNGMITGAYTVMSLKQLYIKEYFYYFYLNLDNDKRLRSLYTGLRNTIQKESFLSFKTFVPPIAEQKAIADFLDSKTEKIDRAIEQKTKLIALLKERKQILIQNAVTKGVPPRKGRKMKDSCVEWIGEIPEEWDVKRLKYVATINSRNLPENFDKDAEIQYVDIGSVSFEKGVENTELYKFKESPSRARRLSKKGDSIISTVRTYLKAIDFINDVKENFVFSTGFAILSPIDGIFAKYLFHVVRSNLFTDRVMQLSKGMSYPAINASELGGICLPLPTFEEQQEIVDYIEFEISKIDQALQLQERQIEKLKEYKSVLVDSAVTGKIQVV